MFGSQTLRALGRSPAFAVTAVSTLAIGIGLNAAVFTVTSAVLFKGFRSIELPYQQQPAGAMWVIARTRVRVAAASFGVAVRDEIQTLDPDLPIWLGPYSLDERLAGSGNYWTTGKNAVLYSIFAAFALLLASLGLYGVVAHAVSQRTQEIGVRVAIGSPPGAILSLVCREGMMQLAIGLAIGLAASLVVTRILTSALVQVSAADPVTYVVASAVLILSAALGCVIPARRAMRVDPVVALRQE